MIHASTQLGTAGRPKGHSVLRAKVAAMVAAAVRTVILWSNRRAVHRLTRLEDRHLKDIGVSRADIDWALSKPWNVDPSLALANRIERRRAAVRWARKLATQNNA